jgi:uncharacterized membrane protein
VKALAVVFHVLLVAGYPLAVYLGLTRYSARYVGILLIVLLLPGLLLRLRGARREDLLAVARVPLAVMAVAGLSALFDDKRFVLAMPVLINGALLATFGSSLWGTPMVERFARLQNPNLGPDHVPYCRAVTKVWCGFFGFNIAMSVWLGLFAPLSWWALYTGIIAYVLIGVLATGEYIVRKERFRDYGSGLHDRILMRLFPPREVHS